MKKLLILIVFLNVTLIFSQSDDLKKQFFKSQLDSIVSNYKGNPTIKEEKKKDEKRIVIERKLLNKRLTNAFNQVVFGSSNLVDNASAFGISQNEEETYTSVNSNFHLFGKSKDQLYIKIGLNANSSGSVFNLYSKNEWRNSVGGSIGLIYKFFGSGITNEKMNDLERNKVLREYFIKDSIMSTVLGFEKGAYKKEREAYLEAVTIKDTAQLKKRYKRLKEIEVFFKQIEKYKSKEIEGKFNFNNYRDTIQRKINDKIIDHLLESLWTSKEGKSKALQQVLKNVALVYDKKNVKNTGYSFWWLDTGVTFNNDTYNFSEKADNIESSVLPAFNALNAKKIGLNNLRTQFAFNVNYALNKLRGSWYLQFGYGYSSGSFLTSNLINGDAKIAKIDTNGLFIIEDVDKKPLGDFASINQNLKYSSFNFYTAYFFGKKKIIGINFAASHRQKIETPQNTFYEDNYSVLLGPIFRKPTKDDDTGLTFGIDIGFDNTLYDVKAKNNFVARIRLGIPFKLYNIKK